MFGNLVVLVFIVMIVYQAILTSKYMCFSLVTVMCQYLHFLNCGSFVSF